MGAREESVRSMLGADVESSPARLARVRVFWWWVLGWGPAIGVAAAIADRLLFPEANLAGPAILKATWCLAAAIGFAAVAYCLVAFALNRALRSVFLSCAFAALATSGILQITSSARVYNDRIVLITWMLAAFLFVGATHASTSLRREGSVRSTLQIIVAVAATAAYPIVLSIYVVNPLLYERLQSFPNQSLCFRFDNVMAFIAAGLIAVAVLGWIRSPNSRTECLDRVLGNFYVACCLGLICRGNTGAVTDVIWFCGQVLSASGWLVLAAGFAAESAIAHKELLNRLRELETTHDVSWSLVGSGGGDNFLSALVDLLRNKVDAEIVAIYLADPSGRSLELAAVSGGDDSYARVGTTYIIASEDRRPGFHTGHIAHAFRSGEMRMADGVFIDVEFVPWRVIARGDGRAISVPLIEQGAALGVLNVYFHERNQLARESITLLTTIATSASPAIGNLQAERSGRKSLDDQLDLAA